MKQGRNAKLSEVLDQFIDQEKLYRTEGRRGVENLCTIVRAIGYKDPQYWGQLSSKAAIGDLICFLEDNSGAIEAMLEWIKERRSPEWTEALIEQLPEDNATEEE